jgi:hypothetical protein
MAGAGRQRVEREFTWPAIAQQTVDLYASLRQGWLRRRRPPGVARA